MKFKPEKRTTAGFTIVELLIVVVVIAILAAITIVAYSGVRSMAETTAVKSDLGTTSKQLSLDNLTTGGQFTKSTFEKYLKANTANVTVSFRYGDERSYCLEGTSTYKTSLQYHIKSESGLTSPADGACPTTYTDVTSRCVAGKVQLIVTVQNPTSGLIDTKTGTVYGERVLTGLTPGQTTSQSFSTSLASMPAGIVTVDITEISTNDLPEVRYHAYTAKNC